MGKPLTDSPPPVPQLALRPKTVDFDTMWANLVPIANAVIRNEKVQRSKFQDCFTDIYQLCTSTPESLVDTLYTNVYELVHSRVTVMGADIDGVDDTMLLNKYALAWTAFKSGARYLDDLFEYLNRQMRNSRQANVEVAYDDASNVFDAEHPPRLSIHQLCMHQWRTIMFDTTAASTLRERLVAQLFDFVTTTRRKVVIPTISNETVKTVIESFIETHTSGEDAHAADVDLYKHVFESPFVELTKQYYYEQSEHLLRTLPFDEYITKTLELLKGESCRAKHLYPASHDLVLTAAQHMMVGEQLAQFNAHIDAYMKEERTNELAAMYELLRTQRTTGLATLLDSFAQHMRRTGEDAVKLVIRRSPSAAGDMPVAHAFVDSMLGVYDKFNGLVSSLFAGDSDFETALERAMTASINYREDMRAPPRASELLAKYCDAQLRKPANKSTTAATDTQIDERLSRAIIVFRFVDDKDIFQKFYQKMLAQRLIHGYASSMHMEELMLDKLKTACGYEFTSKLQRMLTDVRLSDDLNKLFAEHLDTEQSIDESAPTPMTAQILSAGSWPLPCRTSPAAKSEDATSPSPNSIVEQSQSNGVPSALHAPLQAYVDFYGTKHSGRRLQWLFNLCTTEVTMRHLDKPYTVCMSIQQLCVLECYETTDVCTLAVLRARTCMPHTMLLKCIASLVDAQLITASTADEWADTTTFQLNMAYTNRRTKFKIATPATSVKPLTAGDRLEVDTVTHSVVQDRKLFIECAIVRVMKARKVLNHNGLVQEVIRQCRPRFTPEVQSIKTTIESLIDKQYIQRTDNHDEYKYLA